MSAFDAGRVHRSCAAPVLALAAVVSLTAASAADRRQPPRVDDSPCVWITLRPRATVSCDAYPPPCHLSDRAIERRATRRSAAGVFDDRDLDVDASCVARIQATGAEVRVVSRWLNAVSVRATVAQIDAIRSLACVASIAPVARIVALAPRDASDHPAEGGVAGNFYGASEPQIAQLQLDALHAASYTGAGVLVGILDTGFRRTHAAFNAVDHPLSVAAEYDFVNGDGNTAPEPGDAPTQHEHGTQVLGTLGAYQPGTLVGAAYDASYLLAKAEDIAPDTAIEEDYFVAGLEWLEANGADVATSSLALLNVLGPEALDGTTSAMSIAFAIAGENGVHCFQGAGNNGHDADPSTNHLVIPADSFDVIAVGAVSATGTITSFSSDGPTLDGRRKPELLARGASVWTVHPNNDTALASPSGTSFSTPLVAGVAACLAQANPDWTPPQMRAALLSAASDFVTNGAPDPLMVRGYGIARAMEASAASPPSADLNDDFLVNGADVAIVLGAWGECTRAVGCAGDLNHDGSVNASDLAIVLGAWTG
ncbi:MAG: S8 family serine peptidase [Phycisphaerales bacterium]